jgi:hypothetical protein
MKNFVFALCGFLMMTLMSLNVQASVSEPILSKSDVSVNVGLPMVQNDVVTFIPMDYLVVTAPQPVFMMAESPAMQSVTTMNTFIEEKQVIVPKCPFRYVYKSKYCTHYSYAAYSKLITPY